MSNKLLAKKSTLISRRNVVIYMVTIILILGIVAGFTNTFNTDNRRFASAWGETIVMESPVPETGTPEDHNLLDNLRFAAYKLHHASSFRGDTDGRVDADIGIGSYTQYLTNTRIVYKTNTVFTETISSSSMVSLAEQKYADNGIIIYRPSTKISGNKATFSSKAMPMSYENYSEKYGSVPNQLSKYIINEKTILSVKDDNASVKGALNSSDSDGDISFSVPEALVADADGNYSFTLTLDPKESSLYYRNEVRTLAGADQNPNFKSVKITIKIDKNWNPISTRTVEVYDIAIPVIGSTECTGTNVENFSQINDENLVIPEKDFFQPYVDEAKKSPGYKPPDIVIERPTSPSDYLAAAFEGYISGKKNLDLTMDITADDISANRITVSVNLSTMEINAMLGKELYLGFKDDKIYLKVNDVNGYIAVEDAKKLADNSVISGIIGSLGDFDVNKLFGGNMLDTIFGKTEMTVEGGITTIPMSFPLDLSDIVKDVTVQVDAAIIINDADKSLKSIVGDVTVNGTKIHVDAKPLAKAPSFPSVDSATSLSGMLDFVPDIIATAMQKTYGIDGTFTLNGLTADLSAYIDRTDGIAAEAHIGVAGVDVAVKYVNEYIYVNIGGINVRGTVDELPALLDALLKTSGLDKYMSLIKALLPATVNGYAKMLNTITTDGNRLDIGLDFIGIPIDLRLDRADGKLSKLGLDVNVDMFGITASVAAELDISCPERRAVTAPTATEFATFDTLAKLIESAAPYISAKNNLNIGIDGSVTTANGTNTFGGSFAVDKATDKDGSLTGVNARGTISALGQSINVTYADGTAYISIGNILARFDTQNSSDLIAAITRLFGMLPDVGLDDADISELVSTALDGLTLTERGALVFGSDVNGVALSASVDLKLGVVKFAAKHAELSADVTVTLDTTTENRGISAPINAEKYIDINELSPAVETALDIYKSGRIAATVKATLNGNSYEFFIEAMFAGELKLRITERTLPFELIFIQDTVYISVGNIRLSGNKDEIADLYAALQAEFALPTIDGLIDMLPSFDISSLIGNMLDSVTTIELKDGVISTVLNIDGVAVAVSCRTDLGTVDVKANIDGMNAAATLILGGECGNITAPDGEFTPASEFTEIIPTITALVNSNALAVSYSASVGSDAAYSATGTAVASMHGGISVATDVNAVGQLLNVAYADDTIYLRMGDFKFKLETSDIAGIIPKLNKLFAALGINTIIPESIDISAIASSLDMEQTIRTALDCIKSFYVENGAIYIAVEYNGISGAITVVAVDEATFDLTVAVAFGGTELTLPATLRPTTQTVAAPADAAEYSDLNELGTTIDAAAELIAAGTVSATAKLSLDDIVLYADIAAEFKDGLKVRVTESSLGLDMVLAGDTAYISVGGIFVSGRISDLTDLMKKIVPALPAEIGVYAQRLTERITDMIPSGNDIASDGKLDIQKTLDFVTASVTQFTLTDMLTVKFDRNGLKADLKIATDLSHIGGNIEATFVGVGGMFGDKFVIGCGVELNGITTEKVQIPAVDRTRYVSAAALANAVDCVLPLIGKKAFDIDVYVTLFDQTVTGNIYVDLGAYTLDTLAASASFDVAGANINVTLKQKTLYIDINNGSVKISQALEKDAISSLIAQLDAAMPELGIQSKLGGLTDLLGSMPQNIDLAEMLNKVALSPTPDGALLTVNNGKIGISAELWLSDGALSAIVVSGNADGKPFTIDLGVTVEGGVLTRVETSSADFDGTSFGFGIGIATAEQERVQISDEGYISPAEFIPYIAPMMSLMTDATAAKTLTVDLADMTVEILKKQMCVSGRITIALDPITVKADLVLFSDSETDKIDLSVLFADGVMYISVGEIMLKFDTENDTGTLLKAIDPYLPKCIKNLGDLGAFTTISALIGNINSIIAATDTTAIAAIMFDDTNAYGKSMIKQVADMLKLIKVGNSLKASLTVMEIPFDVTLNVAPVINGEFVDFVFDTAITDMFKVGLTAKLYFSDEQLLGATVASPEKYVPVVQFVTTVIDAVNTLTASTDDIVTTDENGNTVTVSQTAFEVETFNFDYDIFKVKTEVDENGNTVEVVDKETGREVIVTDDNGNKVVEQTIKVSDNGQKALRFGYTTTEITDVYGKTISKKSQIAVEAHLKLDIQELQAKYDTNGKITSQTHVSKLGFPIELDLYVAPTAEHPEGLAYLYYREANGFGEKLSIDYTSVMQIVAAVMDIVNADDATIDALLKDYRLPIDTTVFDSMSIVGLDAIGDTLDNIVKAINEIKLGISDAGSAWNRLQAAENIDELIRELVNAATSDGAATIKTLADSALTHIKTAVALFAPADDESSDKEEAPIQDNKLNGALFGKVVNSVRFESTETVLSAVIDNMIATGTDGEAIVSVASHNNKINNIGVENLDVNKAKLNKFAIRFAPTQNVEITIPADYNTENTSDYKLRYADFANIKHLLFDVMNTANLMEFDIGGLDTSDTINVTLNLAGRDAVNIDIYYNAKVKIIEDGKNADGDPVYKTAAAIELMFKNCKALGATVVQNCTTRLFFYDDVIYIQGVDYGSKNQSFGYADVTYKTSSRYQGKWYPEKFSEDFQTDFTWDTTNNYVYYMFTVDELFHMIKNDLSTFLSDMVFKLVPLSKDFSVFGIDLQKAIIDAMAGSTGSSNTVNTENTIAQIFKSYKYDGSTHQMIIGLKELAGVSALSDLTVDITGANDEDDDGINGNVLNNYISKLNVITSIQNGLVNINLGATLRNVKPTANGKEIESKGFAPVDVTTQNGTADINGNSYILDYVGYAPDTLYTIDGTFVSNNVNGTDMLYTENGTLPAVSVAPVSPADNYEYFIANNSWKGCPNLPDGKGYQGGDGIMPSDGYTIRNRFTKGYRVVGTNNCEYYVGKTEDGETYVYRMENGNKIRIAVKSITGSLLAQVTRDATGKISAVTNRTGGIQWSRPWQAAYESAQAAA